MRTLGTTLAALLAGAVAAVGLAAAPTAYASGGRPARPAAAGGATGEVTVVQAVPGAQVGLSVDGEQRGSALGVGSMTGPLELTAGTH